MRMSASFAERQTTSMVVDVVVDVVVVEVVDVAIGVVKFVADAGSAFGTRISTRLLIAALFDVSPSRSACCFEPPTMLSNAVTMSATA